MRFIEYSLVPDHDGHWWVIPAEKLEEFWRYLDLVESAEEIPAEPPWADRVGGSPVPVRFTGYRRMSQ